MCAITRRRDAHFGPFACILQLVKADDEEKVPVAEFHPHKRHFFVFRMSRHAFLEIKPIPEMTGALERLIGQCQCSSIEWGRDSCRYIHV